MWNLEIIARNALKLNENDALKVVTDNKSIQYQAVLLNRQVQLYEQGVGVDGRQMKSYYARGRDVYALKTIKIKQEKGQPTDRITLRDTGKMYQTFNTKLVKGELVLTANTIKESDDLQDNFGQFVGLTAESKSELVQQAKPIILQYVKSKILQ
jgi:Tfp pilus assembly PilM family ATPase